ncbi:MAG: hypothetical protein WC767_01005 [Candidatus Paceibacterota bacterium]|jgi:hypothetical protein
MNTTHTRNDRRQFKPARSSNMKGQPVPEGMEVGVIADEGGGNGFRFAVFGKGSRQRRVFMHVSDGYVIAAKQGGSAPFLVALAPDFPAAGERVVALIDRHPTNGFFAAAWGRYDEFAAASPEPVTSRFELGWVDKVLPGRPFCFAVFGEGRKERRAFLHIDNGRIVEAVPGVNRPALTALSANLPSAGERVIALLDEHPTKGAYAITWGLESEFNSAMIGFMSSRVKPAPAIVAGHVPVERQRAHSSVLGLSAEAERFEQGVQAVG